MNYHIREIKEKDNKQVEKVIRSCLIEFGANHEGTAWMDPNLGNFSNLYSSIGNKYWVVVDENDAVYGGVGVGQVNGNKEICELQKMYFLPEVRGSGMATKIIQIALDYAKGFYRQCYLETLENMVAAQKFYEKNGFKRTKQAPFDTGHFACDIRYIKDLKEKKER